MLAIVAALAWGIACWIGWALVALWGWCVFLWGAAIAPCLSGALQMLGLVWAWERGRVEVREWWAERTREESKV